MARRVPNNAPLINELEQKRPSVNDWFREVGNRMNVYSGTSDPTADDVPENQWIVFNNTSLSEVRIWTNIAGTVKKSAAFT